LDFRANLAQRIERAYFGHDDVGDNNLSALPQDTHLM
jgi:hypothetical protein